MSENKCTHNNLWQTPKCGIALWRSQIIEDISRVLVRHDIENRAHVNPEHDLILIDLRKKSENQEHGRS